MKSFLICTAFTCISQQLITLSRNTCYHCIQVEFALFTLIINPIKKKKKVNECLISLAHRPSMKRANLSIFMSPFSFPSLSLCDSGGSDSLCQSQVPEDKGLQWLLLQAGSLSARELESHSQSHITVVLIRLSPRIVQLIQKRPLYLW